MAAPSSEAEIGAVADPKAMAALYGNRAASYVMILGYEQVTTTKQKARSSINHWGVLTL